MTIPENFPPDSRLPYVDELNGQQIKQLQSEAAQGVGMGAFCRDTLKSGALAPELAIIPAGRFEMGSNPTEFGHQREEAPRHLTNVSRPFALGVYPVTAEEFDQFRKATEWEYAARKKCYLDEMDTNLGFRVWREL